MESRTPKAIALVSGGLDSTLAARLVRDQGVEVVGLHLASPFACRADLQAAARSAGISLIIRDKGEAYMDLLRNPKFGRGRNMNPCLDCRIFMFEWAEQVRQEQGADFVVTGEVIGQRPMSQVRRSMELIDKHSPLEDRILRPLSAHRFPPTLPEREGWVNRDSLLGLAGRSRKPQLEMAREMGLQHFEAPGGGCLLTQDSFAERIRDYFAHDDDVPGAQRLARAELLRVGRHFRVTEGVRAIVARRSEENSLLEKQWRAAGGLLLTPQNFKGPTAVALGTPGPEDLHLVAQLLFRYGKSDGPGPHHVKVSSGDPITVRSIVPETTVKEMML